MKRLVLSLFFLTVCLFVGEAAASSPYDGWWYSPDESGSGVSIEIQGDTLFGAIYSYVEGYPVWFTIVGEKDKEENVYSGNVFYWFLGDMADLDHALYKWKKVYPDHAAVGEFAIAFAGTDAGGLAYQVGDSDLVSVGIEKFMPTVASGPSDSRVLGWWYDPGYDGTGVYLEARGGTLFGAYYTYRGNSEGTILYPFWFTFVGELLPNSNHAHGIAYKWAEGSMLGIESYVSPVSIEFGYTVDLTLNPDGTIDFQIDPYDGRANAYSHKRSLQRFNF